MEAETSTPIAPGISLSFPQVRLQAAKSNHGGRYRRVARDLVGPRPVTSGNRDLDGPLAFLDRERILLLILGLILFLPGLGRHDLWNPDEPRCAEIAREMEETANYLVPQLNGDLPTGEPPLHFWAISSMSLLLGRLDETAVRLPSALAAIATSLLVFSI